MRFPVRVFAKLKRPRWWIPIAILCGFFVFVGSRESKYRRAQKVINEVQRQGGYALARNYGPEWLEGVLDEFAPSLAPRFKTRVFAIEYPWSEDQSYRAPLDLSFLEDCPDLHELDLSVVQGVDDDDLVRIGTRLQLKHLRLNGQLITNRGLRSIGTLNQLQSLFLIDTDIDDAGLTPLEHMPQLQELILTRSRNFTGMGLRHISERCSLTALDVSESQFQRGLDEITLASLQKFYAAGTPLDDDTLTPLTDAHELEVVSIGRTQVTDNGLDHIASLPKLNSLALNGTQITDTGIERLSGLRSLRLLIVKDTTVTRDAARRLVAQLPSLAVAFGPDEAGNLQFIEGADVDKEQ